MDSLKTRLTRLAALKALLDVVKARYDAERASVTVTMLKDGVQQQRALLDGEPIGSASVTAAKTEAVVVDHRAFLAYVKEAEPSAVVVTETVAEGYASALLSHMTEHGGQAVTQDGEVIPGVGLRTRDAYVSMRGVDSDKVIEALASKRLGFEQLKLTDGGK